MGRTEGNSGGGGGSEACRRGCFKKEGVASRGMMFVRLSDREATGDFSKPCFWRVRGAT